MKTFFAMALLCSVVTAASADELADGVTAWKKRDFAQAHEIYGRLARAGDIRAQVLLGELYGFGEGVPEDSEVAERWLGRALAAGSTDARAALDALQQRARRKAEIARYVDGADSTSLRLENFGCVRPVYPEVSRTQPEMRQVIKSTKAWRACYSLLADSLAAQMPPGKVIPEDLLQLMSLTEFDRARTALDQGYVQSGELTSAQALAILAEYQGWWVRTEKLTRSMEKKTLDDSLQRSLGQ